jgi:tyrosine-specific transport protein
VFGGAFLVAGTCVGAVAVALPVSLASLGFLGCCLAFGLCWVLMAWTGCLVLEVNAQLPHRTSYASMALATFGPWGARLTTLIYGMLLYSLLAAYMTGGSDILVTIGHFERVSSDLISGIWWGVGSVVLYLGVRWIDGINRYLLLGLLGAFIIMLYHSVPQIESQRLWDAVHLSKSTSVYLMIIGAFGYQVIVPSVRRYCHDHSSDAQKAIVLGSFIPFVLYILWTLCVLGTLPSHGLHSLDALRTLAQPARWLPLWMSAGDQGIAVIGLKQSVEVFVFCAIATSFLGIALSVYDFIQDLSQLISGQILPRIWSVLITLSPPLIYAHVWPNGFVQALKYAGLMVLLLNICLPIAMVWRVRSGHCALSVTYNYRAPGGKVTLISVSVLIVCLTLGLGYFS